MKKLILLTLLLLTVPLMAACGGDDDGGDDSSAIDETAFTVTVTGAQEATLAGAGRLICSPDIGDGELELSINARMSNNVLISLPRGIEPGTHTFDDPMMAGPGTSITLLYLTEEMTNAFESEPDGTIELTAVPTTGGEAMTGSFEVTVTSSNTGDTVTLNGEFDFTAGEAEFSACDGA